MYLASYWKNYIYLYLHIISNCCCCSWLYCHKSKPFFMNGDKSCLPFSLHKMAVFKQYIYKKKDFLVLWTRPQCCILWIFSNHIFSVHNGIRPMSAGFILILHDSWMFVYLGASVWRVFTLRCFYYGIFLSPSCCLPAVSPCPLFPLCLRRGATCVIGHTCFTQLSITPPSYRLAHN